MTEHQQPTDDQGQPIAGQWVFVPATVDDTVKMHTGPHAPTLPDIQRLATLAREIMQQCVILNTSIMHLHAERHRTGEVHDGVECDVVHTQSDKLDNMGQAASWLYNQLSEYMNKYFGVPHDYDQYAAQMITDEDTREKLRKGLKLAGIPESLVDNLIDDKLPKLAEGLRERSEQQDQPDAPAGPDTGPTQDMGTPDGFDESSIKNLLKGLDLDNFDL